MNVKFLNLTPDDSLLQELIEAHNRVMHSGYFIGGPEVEAFEQEWADYCNAQYCVSCGSGQSALSLLLKAHNVGYGDEVIVPSWTAIPTWKAVMDVGATPRPVDVDYDTMLLEPDAIWLKLMPSSFVNFREIKAVIPVHLYGYRAAIDNYGKVAIINDACQAHGLKDLGDAAWSFYPTKNLGAYGDGGAVTTDNQEIAKLCRVYRDSSRLDSLQAAFLRVKLKYLDKTNDIRIKNASVYDGLISSFSPYVPSKSVYHQYVIRSKERDKLRSHLYEKGVETMIHYPTPPHRQLIGIANGQYPNADRLAQEALSLPITCSQEQVEYVCEVINEFYKR